MLHQWKASMLNIAMLARASALVGSAMSDWPNELDRG